MRTRLFLSIIAAMLSVCSKAQVTPIVLGDKHAMVHVVKSKYVMLPVQESEEIAAVAVIGENELKKNNINLKNMSSGTEISFNLNNFHSDIYNYFKKNCNNSELDISNS